MHLQALQGKVVLPRLSLVGDEDEDDDDEEEPSAGRDADDGREGQQAVGHDVDGAGGDVEAAHLNLWRETRTRVITRNLKSAQLWRILITKT